MPNKTVKKSPADTVFKGRVRKKPIYKTLRLAKRIKHPVKLSGSLSIFGQSIRTLHKNRTLFGGIIVIYAVLSVVLVRGFGSTDLSKIKDAVNGIGQGFYSQIGTAFGLFSSLLSSSGNNASDPTNPSAGVAATYQLFLGLIVSLALIYGLRHVLANKKVRIRDAFYKGLYPIAVFILVLAVIGLQLVPVFIGKFIIGIIFGNDIAPSALERGLWYTLFGLVVLLSVYMVSSSIFALYIATLPDMTPLKALRSARELVLHRRWAVLWRVVALPFYLLIMAAVIIVPLIYFVTPIAEWAFFLISIIYLAVVHSYMYTLYRELLQ